MAEELTPMMRQYRRIKTENAKDAILMFRLGDFYEMFFEDAKIASEVLGLTLTHRAGAPMCGVPYHAIEAYLSKLVKAGLKAAICEQLEDPATAKGIVRREVTRIVTPGTIFEDGLLDATRNNYLLALAPDAKPKALALLDLSTGDLSAEEFETPEEFSQALLRYNPSECLVPEGCERLSWLSGLACPVTTAEEWTFSRDAAYDLLVRHFGVQSLDGFGCQEKTGVIRAAGGLLYYVGETLRNQTGHIRSIQLRNSGDFLTLDASTVNNLDILPLRGKPLADTLLGVLDTTHTPMGARLLRNWLARPLGKLEAIVSRHEAVGQLVAGRLELTALQNLLRSVHDLERLLTRLEAGNGNARDLKGLGVSLLPLPALKERIAAFSQGQSGLLGGLAEAIEPLPELAARIDKALVETPPVSTKEGGMIAEGWNRDLDELRALSAEGHGWLAQYQAKEAERTGIKGLKVRHNRVFGYYIEVSKGQTALVPPEYERRQTLVNAERYITPELKEYEQKIFGAQDKAIALEQQLFQELRAEALAFAAGIRRSAQAIATTDVLTAFADRALALGYVRPQMTVDPVLEIKDGRHPVVEQLPNAERFIANDTKLNATDHQVILITGPNMAGKSTYIRQVALILIMAQAGSWVPAREARIGIADKVFTRVGAGDELAKGRSTFMVEMQEAANILNNATPQSLVVLDELGRGTSTFDGISLAWSVAEYLHNTAAVKARTLFATHYHELTDLARGLSGVKNYTVQVRERGDSIVFLRRIVPGCADKSYGIHVARLAGMPPAVIDRAKEILANLEDNELDPGAMPKLAQTRQARRKPENPNQLLMDF